MLFAQEETYSLNEIMISESRVQIPFRQQNRNLQVLDSTVINALPVKSVNELLTYVAGVDVRQRGPWGVQTDIGIDGGTFDQTLILVNGVKVNDPQTGHNTMSLPIALDAIERIEVLRGAAARIYGLNALNGAINIVTKKPLTTGANVRVYSGTSFKRDTVDQSLYTGNGISATGSLRTSRAGHSLSFSNDLSSGYRYNTAFNNSRLFYQNFVNLSPGNLLEVMAGYNFNDFGANLFYAAPNDREAKETFQNALASAVATFQMTNKWVVKPRLSYRFGRDSYIYIRQKPESFHNIHTTNTIDAELNTALHTSSGILGVGIELREEKINSNNLGNHNRSNYGLSIEYTLSGLDRMMINAGVYTSYNSDYGWQLFPGIDMGYDLKKGLRLFANIGTGQRLPTYTDLYYKGPTNIGNDKLAPEHSFSSEGGVKWNVKGFNGMLSGFLRRTTNFIDWVKYQVSDPWQPMNARRIDTRGLSVSTDYRSPAVFGTPCDVSYRFSYTWLVPKISTELPGDIISNYALNGLRNQLTGNVVMTYRHLSLTAGGRYIDRISASSVNYFLLDLRVSLSSGSLAVYADVSNLTNKEYVEAAAVPMPGRWCTLGLKWNWRSQEESKRIHPLSNR